MIHKFVQAVERELKPTLDREVEALLNGSATDFADYKRRVGLIKGLRQGTEAMRTVEKKYLMEEDSEG